MKCLLLRRATLFSYLENLIIRLKQESEAPAAASPARAEYERILGIVRQSKDDLVAVGYEEFAVESFHEVEKTL